MKRKFDSADDVHADGIPTKVMLTSADGVMFNDVTIGNQYGGSPMVHSRPVSTSTPYANSNSYRRQNHENISISNGFVRQHQMPPTGQSTSTSRSDEELRRVVDNFVSVYEKLDRTDTADAKPNYSYTELAFLALLRAPNFALPITEIYKYIQSRFLFYKHSTRKHWKNAVRHSLAKTLCFTKIPVGRGSSQNEKLSRSTYLWCVIPSSIACFARGDYRPSRDGDNSAETLKWGYYQANAERFWLEVGDFMATKMASFKRLIQESFDPGLILEAQVCMLPNDGVAGNTNNSTWNSKGRQPLRKNHQIATNHQFAVQNNSLNSQCGATTGYAGNQLQYHENKFQQQQSSTPVAAQAHYFQGGLAEKVASPPLEQDPWMPRFSIVSPDLSLSSVDSQRRTPPYTPRSAYDSGFDTCDSSPEESSCKLLNSCSRLQNSDQGASPCLARDNFNSSILSDECLSDLNRFSMSPFSLSDFSEACPNICVDRKLYPDDLHTQRLSPTPCMEFNPQSLPLTSRVSPPSSVTGNRWTQTPKVHVPQTKSESMFQNFDFPVPPQRTYAYTFGDHTPDMQFVNDSQDFFDTKPSIQPSNYNHTPHQSATLNTSVPILIMNTDGTVSTANVSHWNTPMFAS